MMTTQTELVHTAATTSTAGAKSAYGYGKRSRLGRRSCLVMAGVAAIFLTAISQPCLAASASAASGAWFTKPAAAASGSVWFGTIGWATTATIKWTLPTFTADGVALPTAPVPFSEPKFGIAGGFPTARVFTGYNVTGTGPLGSTATSVGSGSSNVGMVFYGANWNVTASGSGTYNLQAVATDPWDIFPSDLSSMSGSTYSLYLPFSMLGGSSGTTAAGNGFGYDVTYITASGTTTLLDVSVNGSTGVVTTSSAFGSNLKFYVEGDSTTAPMGAATPGTLISASDLQNLVSSRIDSGGNLTQSIHLGIVLSGIAIPTQTFGYGTLAQIGATAEAHAAAAVPEPCTLGVLGVGGATLLARRRRKQSAA